MEINKRILANEGKEEEEIIKAIKLIIKERVRKFTNINTSNENVLIAKVWGLPQSVFWGG